MKHNINYKQVGFYVAIVLSFIVLLSAIWLQRIFYSPDRLSDITTEVLQEQSSRDAISGAVVSRLFEERPLLAATAGPRLVPVISGLLDSDILANSINRTVERIRLALTSDEAENIAINLVPVKSTISTVQNVIGQDVEERRLQTEDIPNEIVILDASTIPNYSDEGVVILWLGPLAATFLIIVVGIWLYRGRKRALALRVRIVGMLAVVSSVVALLIGPLTQPIIVQRISTIEGKTIIGNLYEALVAPFNQMALLLLLFSSIVIVISFILPKINSSINTKK